MLTGLSDRGLGVALRSRAKARGMVLNEAVSNYLVTHYPRDTRTLFKLLEMLDRQSLEAQRKLTIPFIKEVLAGQALC